jgi:di/tricarboxylate transporter
MEARVLSGPIPWPKWPVNALVCVGSVLLICRLVLQLFTAPSELGQGEEGEG